MGISEKSKIRSGYVMEITIKISENKIRCRFQMQISETEKRNQIQKCKIDKQTTNYVKRTADNGQLLTVNNHVYRVGFRINQIHPLPYP